ncbi:dnaJ homolog dnj-5 [Achroia grisella]|uniref:dnaJ homolog dnj-5 n=1 Tax=Achroia grisella TaxID=688607 RepID=UPI0027D345A1|nr:dnaJ homolog dnj-5 [Achroia grisella]
MPRSPKNDPRYNDAWNYGAENAEKCAPGALNDRQQTPITSSPSAMNDNSVYVNANYNSDIYGNKHSYNVLPGDPGTNKDEKIGFNNMQNLPHVNRQNYSNATLNWGDGQSLKVYVHYDENGQPLIMPLSQYELYNHNQGLREVPIQSQATQMFATNQDYSTNNNIHVPPNVQNSFCPDSGNETTPNFLKDFLGNLEPNSTGTYSPFGQNYPLNHPDAPTLNMMPNPIIDTKAQAIKTDNSPKRNENSPLADTSNKKRIVAEVKPMRPTYSDVLAKNTKNSSQLEAATKVKPQNTETKTNKSNSKPDKPTANLKHNDDNKHKNDKKQQSTISSGSESGDINTDDTEKQKPSKKSKNKRGNMTRKWSSLDDITNEEDGTYEHGNESQFVFIENQEKPKREKKLDNKVKANKNAVLEDEFKLDEDDDSQFILQENPNEISKLKKKKDNRNYHKSTKPVQDKKKVSQTKVRRNKPGYLGLAQNYFEHWSSVTWKALVWFAYLLSDICRMSFHLSFDLCTSVFTQTYVSSQAVWRSSKDWLSKMKDNKYLMYIDRKFGHTRFAFWRRLKWFKNEADSESSNGSTKLNTNIPLPATGDEAMKRLLACKGKDPYSILGVSVTCTDEEIKRYYRRQAFLVHPDKNQQPGAEEAFKILQHAFELIGEPERREAYERRALESRHVEAAWSEFSHLLAQLHDKMEFAANTIRCTNCGRRHKRVLTERPCYAARYCATCRIRHSAKEGDIWAESSMIGLLVMYYACMDGAVYQITQWASCQKKNLKQLRPDCHVVQYRIVLGNKAAAASELNQRPSTGHDPNLEEFLNNLYSKSGASPANNSKPPECDAKKRRNKKAKV